jgi:hypothetical protein
VCGELLLLRAYRAHIAIISKLACCKYKIAQAYAAIDRVPIIK